MEFANQLILAGAGLVALSVVVGLISSRFGAPLLLAFLVLGMLAGEDGPGGIAFDDFNMAYLIGSVALAIILFDGGLRTSPGDLRSALAPAALLASLGVLVTAAATGAAASLLLGLSWLEGLLVGSIVASTDAAAVFLLLHGHGLRLRERIRSTLEVEAGLNDPMAVFLTVTCVGLLTAAQPVIDRSAIDLLLARFAVQALGGVAIGVVSGFVLLWLTNRLDIAPGLYPVLAVSTALLIFAGAQEVGASGFLAVYLAGYVFGSRRHRATQIINRFLDGMAWLSQIALFLMLGLLVTPSALLPNIAPALGVALVLILVARPAAVWLCLPALRFNRKEMGFVSWVGLRGAVPIYLGTIPVLAGIDGARMYFDVIYVVVIASLVVQGWTVAFAGRRLGLVRPPRPAPPLRYDVDLPTEIGRGVSIYTVQPDSLALRRTLKRLPLPPDTAIISVYRDGEMHPPGAIARLAVGDQVLLVSPNEHLPLLDRLFGRKQARAGGEGQQLLGEFVLSGDACAGTIGEAYEFQVPARYRDMPVGAFMRHHLFGRLRPGRRLRIGAIELVVREVAGDDVSSVAVELEPEDRSLHRLDPLRIWLRARWDSALHAIRAGWRRLRARTSRDGTVG